MSAKIRYTIMPDFGGAYEWVNKPQYDSKDAIGSNHACCSGGWSGEHPISRALEQDFAEWQRGFELGIMDGRCRFMHINWPAFHERWMDLTQRLKAELGDEVEVRYRKPCEDPNHNLFRTMRALPDGTFETVLDQAELSLPKGGIPDWFPRKLMSGGQTGADRGALDFAINNSIPHGCWCPMGRRASDGVVPVQYQFQETVSTGYRQRTKLNVQESDGTLVINSGELDGGTALTVDFASKFGKPCLVIQLERATKKANADSVREWMQIHQIQTLNVAGPREEKRPGIRSKTESLLMTLIGIG